LAQPLTFLLFYAIISPIP